MDGFQRRSEFKKRNIIQAALSLFTQHGVQKVTIAEIAKKANVSQVSIYNYFESKEGLTQQVFKYYVDEIWNEQKAILDSDDPIDVKLKKIALTKTDITSNTNNKFIEDFMKDFASGKSYVEEVYTNEALPRLMHFFDEGKKQGFINPTISNEAILVYLQMFTEYMQKDGVAETLIPLTEDISNLFFYGIFGKRE